MQLFGNMIQPYIAYYNRGTAELNISEYDEAEEDFRASLRENPPKAELCKIYVNLFSDFSIFYKRGLSKEKVSVNFFLFFTDTFSYLFTILFY